VTDSNPYAAPQASDYDHQQPAPCSDYRPYSRGRVYAIFILGMHTAGFMMFFFHPLFALIAIGCGIPAVVLANKEIEEFPQAAEHGFVKWGKRTGQIGLIGGPIVLALWIIVLVVVLAVA
jgi:hypothetical protein